MPPAAGRSADPGHRPTPPARIGAEAGPAVRRDADRGRHSSVASSVAEYLRDARSQVKLFDLAGKFS
jgi:hypothetical protein